MWSEDQLNQKLIVRELIELPDEELQVKLDAMPSYHKDHVVLAELSMEIYGPDIVSAWAELGRSITAWWDSQPAQVRQGTKVAMTQKEIRRSRTKIELVQGLASSIWSERYHENEKEKKELAAAEEAEADKPAATVIEVKDL
jgi:hypothetical protein